MGLFSDLVVATLPFIPKSIVKSVARRYIAGPFLDDAVLVTQTLMQAGASSTIDVLGEFVESRDRAQQEVGTSASVIGAIHEHALDSYLSVKLTSLGLDIDQEYAYENLVGLVKQAQGLGVFVRMDMENTPYTDVTLDFYRRLRASGFDNVGVVIQAYLRRSEDDVRSLLEYQPSVRLCKGIYVEDEHLAFKDPDEIRHNYQKLLRIMMEANANVRIATHDEVLLQDAELYVAHKGIDPHNVEFQMLLGVRHDRRDDLIAKGYKVRIYVPFGEDWYGYSTRRLKENPQIAVHVAKAVLTGK